MPVTNKPLLNIDQHEFVKRAHYDANLVQISRGCKSEIMCCRRCNK